MCRVVNGLDNGDLEQRNEKIIFESILTTFEHSVILCGKWLEPKTKPQL